jgi:hypothetical protein
MSPQTETDDPKMVLCVLRQRIEKGALHLLGAMLVFILVTADPAAPGGRATYIDPPNVSVSK